MKSKNFVWFPYLETRTNNGDRSGESQSTKINFSSTSQTDLQTLIDYFTFQFSQRLKCALFQNGFEFWRGFLIWKSTGWDPKMDWMKMERGKGIRDSRVPHSHKSCQNQKISTKWNPIITTRIKFIAFLPAWISKVTDFKLRKWFGPFKKRGLWAVDRCEGLWWMF